ncbi:MAG: DUF1844 domain-containing protein [Acidobacteriaceae bacterium]|nr:DUF1844 domain-containing protein [Acidobacteriaceae bacterium]
MAENKKQDFVVTDKRKFTIEGEVRPETTADETAEAAPPATPQAKTTPPANDQTSQSPPPSGMPPVPPPPSAEEQRAQHDAYKQSGKQFEPSPLEGRTPRDYEMTFERLVASLYMTAMMQLGVMHEEGQQPMADVVGAKQTIDTIGVLQEKTKGNLTDTEQNLLQNCLYELRMAFVELTNAIARGPQEKPAAPGAKR